DHPDLHSFPTRRSSDLLAIAGGQVCRNEFNCRIAVRHRRKHLCKRAGLPSKMRASLATAAHCVFNTAMHEMALRDLQEADRSFRSEEHTSELQSRGHLV